MNADTVDRTPRDVAEAPPRVSIITPAYNSAHFIGDALRSAFAQTFPDFEVIVVNDGSQDTQELESVLESFSDDRLVYIKQENRGLAGARNAAIRKARAPLIALLDADDMFEPNYLEIQVAEIDRDPTITVLYPNATLFGNVPEAGMTFMDICPSSGEVTVESLIRQDCTVMICSTIRRDAIIQAGMFDESLRSSEDFDLWLRVLKNGGRIAYHRKSLARYRRRPDSLSANPFGMRESITRALDKAERTLELSQRERDAVQWLRAVLSANVSVVEGKLALMDGDTQTALERFRTANAVLKRKKLAIVTTLLGWFPGLVRLLFMARERKGLKRPQANAG